MRWLRSSLFFASIAWATTLPAPVQAQDEGTLVGKHNKASLAHREGWLQQMLQEHLLERVDVIDRLASRDVRVEDREEKIPLPFLLYLHSFINLVEYRGPESIVVVPWTSTGAQRVRVERRGAECILHVATNAADDTFSSKLYEALLDRKKKGLPLAGATVDVSFNNTLFEQLATQLLTSEAITDFIHKYYGIVLAPPADLPDSQPLAYHEKIIILKQLVDLPTPIWEGTARSLDRIVRMKDGVMSVLGPFVAAEYIRERKEIRLYKAAFSNEQAPAGEKSTQFGSEGVLIHEMGHALWNGLSEDVRRDYFVLSWKDRKTVTPGKRNFITPYSATNPEEDFAEHFSAFVDRSEALQEKANDKYRFIARHFFKNTHYFQSAVANARLFVDSEKPDRTPPDLKGDFEKNIRVVVKVSKDDPTYLDLSADVSGVEDDISGVKDIRLEFGFEKENGDLGQDRGESLSIYFSQFGRFESNPQGAHVSYVMPRGDFKNGKFRLRSVYLVDRAGNPQTLGAEVPLTVDVPGTFTKVAEPPPELRVDPSKIRITPVDPFLIDGIRSEVFEISLPIPHQAKQPSIALQFKVLSASQVTGETEATYISAFSPTDKSDLLPPTGSVTVLGLEVKVPGWLIKKVGDLIIGDAFETPEMFSSKVGDAETKIRVVIDPRTRPQVISLDGLSITQRGSDGSNYSRNTSLPSLENLRFRVRPAATDRTRLDAASNDVRFYFENNAEPNVFGGSVTLLVEVPVDGYEEATEKELAGSLSIRTPSGQTLSVDSVERDPVKPNLIRIRLPLAPNHEKGVYVLNTLRLEEATRRPGLLEKSPHPQLITLPMTFHRTNLKFMDRGIQKTIEIQ